MKIIKETSVGLRKWALFCLLFVFTIVYGCVFMLTPQLAEGAPTLELARKYNQKIAAVCSNQGGWLAVKPDCTLVAWGSSIVVTNVPAAARSGVVAVDAGFEHAVALKSNGTVVAWGDNNFWECTVPAGLNNVVAVATGSDHSLALKADGSVVAWGYHRNYDRNYSYPITVPAAAKSGVIAIAGGYGHSLALKNTGQVIAFGNIYPGDNGWGNPLAVPAAAQSGVVAIGSAGYTAFAVKADGTVVTWGNNLGKQCEWPAAATSGVVSISDYMVLKADGSVLSLYGNPLRDVAPASLKSDVIGIDGSHGGNFIAVKADGSVVSCDGYGNLTTVPAGLNILEPVDAPGISEEMSQKRAAALEYKKKIAMTDYALAVKSGTLIAWNWDGTWRTVPDVAKNNVKTVLAGCQAEAAVIKK